jgi:excisionase family DNA binding protein
VSLSKTASSVPANDNAGSLETLDRLDATELRGLASVIAPLLAKALAPFFAAGAVGILDSSSHLRLGETQELIVGLKRQVDALTAEVSRLRERMPPQLVTVAEASKLLGVSVSTIKRKLRAGEIPSRHVGRSVRVDVSSYAAPSSSDVLAAKRCGGAGSRTHVKGPNRNEARRGLTQQIHEIVWTSRSRSIPRRPT